MIKNGSDSPKRTATLPDGAKPLSVAIANFYAVPLMMYFVLRLLFGDGFWPVACVSVWLNWILLIAFVLLPFAIWARRWITAVMLTIGVIVFLALFWELFLPTNDAVGDEWLLSVMTYNVGIERIPPERLVSFLRGSRADVIGLQELGANQAIAVSEELSEQYPFQALHGGGVDGIGLISRYPIVEEELHRRETYRLPHLQTRLMIGEHDVEVGVIVAHPPPPDFGRGMCRIDPVVADEIAWLAQLALDSQPSIILGDFNMVDQNDNYRLLSRNGLIDSYREVGWGFGATWPSQALWPFPAVARVDYVWHSSQWRAVNARVEENAGSDHLPVFVELVLLEE